MFAGLFTKKTSQDFTVKNYSPMNWAERAFYGLLIFFGLFSFFRYAFWWFKPEHIPTNWLTEKYAIFQVLDFALFTVLSFVVFFGLIIKIGTWFTTWFMKRPVHIEPEKGIKVAFVTCYVPGNEPIEMLKETLIAMRDADYAHHTWVLDEGNTDEVKNLAGELGVYYFTRAGKRHYNSSTGPFRKKTKAGNLNSWRNEYESYYDVVAQVDMDHVPHKDYLTKLLGYFKDEKVGFVGVPQIYKNTDNWIARGSAEQTHFYYGPLQQGFYGAHMPFLIGTTHVYRVKALAGFGGYSPTIAEDYLTGLNFFSAGWKGVYVPEVLAEGLGPITWADYFNQQMRWSYGLFEILFKHTKKHFPKLPLLQKINLIFSQMFYFSGFASFLGFILTFLYLILGINSTNMTLLEWASYSIPAYLSGLMIMMFLHKYYIDPKAEPMIGWRGIFLGQAASIIYTISFIKFITRRKLTYKVTPKDSVASIAQLSAFSVHIVILLYAILGLLISFILGNNSIVMRFWAFLNIGFLILMLVTAYWHNFVSLIKNILSYYRFFEFNPNKPGLFPGAPTDSEKYTYIGKDRNVFITLSVISFVSVTLCMFNFIISNVLMWPLLIYLALTLIYFLVSLTVNIFSKDFDIKAHKSLVKKWSDSLKNSVDIFLPTAGENIEVLKNTWKGIDELIENYKGKIKVYVLDDGARSEVKALAKIFGYNYEVRPNRGWYKKAGNLRHGFNISGSEYIAIFDADFRPRKDFLSELLPYFYQNKSLGLVQSPQYFDVHQSQNWLQRGAGAVQELFYRLSQVSRESHNASICVGSNALYKREALKSTGGTALIEHSEDVHTGFNLRVKGWGLKYIPVVLAKGLCPDDMKSFFKQQYRWCTGSMSLLSSKKFQKSKMGFKTRISYFSGFLYYIHTAITSLFTPLIPLALILLYPEQVTLKNYLLLLPSIIFIQVVYPLWHKQVYGVEAWAIRSVYGWAHLFAIFDILTKRTMQWQATGSKMGKDNRYLTFRILQVIFNFVPAVIWAYLSAQYVFAQNNLMFLPLMLGGFYYLLINAKITFYLPDLSKRIDELSGMLNPKYKTAAFAGLCLIIAGTMIYSAKSSDHPVFSSTKEKLLSQINNQTMPLITPGDIIESSKSAAPRIYTEYASKGESAPILYRRMVVNYASDYQLYLDSGKKGNIVNFLTESKPVKLKTGDKITLTSDDLWEIFSKI